MANHKQFAELLEGFIAGNSTPEEYRALMQLVKSRAYDDVLKKYIDYRFLMEEAGTPMDENRSAEILQSILTSEKHTAQLIPLAISFKKYLRLTAVAASIILMLVAGWWFTSTKVVDEKSMAKKAPAILHPVTYKKGKKYIRLQDGSTVLLNEGSKLDYPDEFKGKLREVTLTGEAYFDIKHDPSRPFIVHTGKVNTVVLGTAFNIKAYPAEHEITVTVTRGKVKVGDNKKTFGVITPNESISVNTVVNTYKEEKVNAEYVIEWKKEYLVLDDITLEDASALINARYHINVSFSKESLRQCRISATFLDNESLEQVLTVITAVVNATYTMQPNDQVIISGEGCK